MPRIRIIQAVLAAGVLGGLLALTSGCAGRNGQPSGAPPGARGRLSDSELEQRADGLAHFAAGTVHDLRSEPVPALEDYRLALEADPANEALAIDLARRHLQSQQPEAAIAAVDITIATGNATGLAYGWRGMALERAGDPEAAAKAFRESVRRSPELLLGYRCLAQQSFQDQDADAALTILDQAAARKNPGPDFLVELADTYALGVREKVLTEDQVRSRIKDALDRAWAAHPDNPDALRQMGDLYQAGGFPDESIRTFELLLAEHPSLNPAVRNLLHEKLFKLHAQQGETGKAQEQLKAMLDNNPTNPQTYVVLAELATGQKRYADAAGYLRRLLLLQPQFEPVYYELAGLELTLRQPGEALTVLERARARFRATFIMELYTAMAHAAMEDYPTALRHLRSAEVVAKVDEPDRLNAFFYFQLGSVYERMKDFEPAETWLRKALELDPEDANTLNYLGYMWADLGVKLDEALALIEKAVALEPNNPAYLDSLAWVLFKLGRAADALPHQQRAIALMDEPDATLLDHLGDMLEALGRRIEAGAAWRRALDLEENEATRRKLEEGRP